MAVHEIIPNENVLVADIGNTLNANGGSVNINQPATFFTTSANINPWSKKKPVYREELFCQDYNSSKPDYVAKWWEGKDGKCGFTIPSVTSLADVATNTTGGMNGWVYNIPSSPKRIGDFCGYYPSATPVVSAFAVTGQVSSSDQGAKITGMITANASGTSTQLSLDEFPFLKSCYFGFFIRKGSSYVCVTSTKTIGNSGTDAQINAYGLDYGTWDAYPFLSTSAITQVNGGVTSTFYMLPNCSAQSVVVEDSSVRCKVECNYVYGDTSDSTKKTAIFVTSITITGTPGTYSTNAMYIRKAGRSWSDAKNDNYKEANVTLDNFTIPSSGSYTIMMRGTNSMFSINNYEYVIWVTLNSAKYKFQNGIGDVVLPT